MQKLAITPDPFVGLHPQDYVLPFQVARALAVPTASRGWRAARAARIRAVVRAMLAEQEGVEGSFRREPDYLVEIVEAVTDERLLEGTTGAGSLTGTLFFKVRGWLSVGAWPGHLAELAREADTAIMDTLQLGYPVTAQVVALRNALRAASQREEFILAEDRKASDAAIAAERAAAITTPTPPATA